MLIAHSGKKFQLWVRIASCIIYDRCAAIPRFMASATLRSHMIITGTAHLWWPWPSWRQFKSDCHQTSSVIPLTTGDELIKFWKVKVKSSKSVGSYALYEVLNALLVYILNLN